MTLTQTYKAFYAQWTLNNFAVETLLPNSARIKSCIRSVHSLLTHVGVSVSWCAIILMTYKDLQLIGCLLPTSHNYRLLSFYNHANHTTTTGYCTVLIFKGFGFDSNISSQLKTHFCVVHGYSFCFLFCTLETHVAKWAIRLTMFVRLLAVAAGVLFCLMMAYMKTRNSKAKKVKWSRYRPRVAQRGFQEVKVPRYHDNGTEWW